MARSGINKVILVGNLGQDPEVKYTAGGAAVTTLSLATSESWKDKDTGSDQERTEWHRVVLWRRLAEIAGEYLKKGSTINIASDSKSYIAQILETIHYVKNDFAWLNQSKSEWDYDPKILPETKYFKKALKNGHNPFFVKLEKL